MALLDTSVLVRYLSGDPPEAARTARRIVEETGPLYLTCVVLAETAYTLASFYGVEREAVVDSLLALITRSNIQLLGPPEDLVSEALLLCRPSGRVSFADALMWAEARAAGIDVVYTFDRRFPDQDIQVRISPDP